MRNSMAWIYFIWLCLMMLLSYEEGEGKQYLQKKKSLNKRGYFLRRNRLPSARYMSQWRLIELRYCYQWLFEPLCIVVSNLLGHIIDWPWNYFPKLQSFNTYFNMGFHAMYVCCLGNSTTVNSTVVFFYQSKM